ncbi:zinc finger, CCHC-type containing protein [Tanacetum coccineum]
MLPASCVVVYVLTTPIPEDGENATVDQIRRRNKWDNDDYVCRGLILKGMFDPLFDIYQNHESRKELWVSLEAKYMAKDASSKKFRTLQESIGISDSDKPKGTMLLVTVIDVRFNPQRDAIFDDNRFSSVPRPSKRSMINGIEDIGGSVFHKEVAEEYDPKTYDEAMKSQDVAFGKEEINDEMDSIMGNNTWVLADVPQVANLLVENGSSKEKLMVDGTIEMFKAIRMDVKTAFLNGELDEEVYMNQSQGFIMPDNENKVCKLIKYLYRLKQAPKQWYQKFDDVVLSSGYLLNQADKCVYSKFDETSKGVICLYVDDMPIFGTDQV